MFKFIENRFNLFKVFIKIMRMFNKDSVVRYFQNHKEFVWEGNSQDCLIQRCQMFMAYCNDGEPPKIRMSYFTFKKMLNGLSEDYFQDNFYFSEKEKFFGSFFGYGVTVSRELESGYFIQ